MQQTQFMVIYLFKGETPVRDENSKFYVSKQEFPCAMYDDYVEGI